MKKLLFLLVVIASFLFQACNTLISSQNEPNDSTTATFEVTVISTRTLSPPTSISTPSHTPTQSLINLEGLKVIDALNISGLDKISSLQSTNSYPISLYWTPDNKEIYILKSNGDIEIWDIETSRLSRKLESENNNVYSVGWRPERLLVAYTDKFTNEVSVWDLKNNAFLFNLGFHSDAFINDQSVSWSPDGTKIVSAGWDNKLKIWDASTGVELKTIQRDSLWFESVSWSPDGQSIVAGHKDGTVYVINAKTWKTVNVLYGHNGSHSGGVPSVSWSPDGTMIASGGRDESKVLIWNFAGELLQQMDDQPLTVFGLNWSIDSTMIASSGEGRDVIITEAATGVELLRLGKHKPSTCCVAWSPNGKMLATVDADGVIKIWAIRP